MNRAESFEKEIRNKERFEFGKNWKKFLKSISDKKITQAEKSIKSMLELNDLTGKTFLDIGSGSGIFSLAAKNLGAQVHSFDYDKNSFWCTNFLKEKFYPNDNTWKVEMGSVLDDNYIKSIGKFDIVYSWGVLHHTGSMYKAMSNAGDCVSKNGKLFIALYNKQQFASDYWLFIKKLYNKIIILRPFLIFVHFIYPTLPSISLNYLRNRQQVRAMNYWHDLLDWLGGYPFEVSTPEEIFHFYRQRGFQLEELKTVGGKLGCNEFVFREQN